MSGLGTFYGSTIGKKVVMAITGIVLIGYLVLHVLGNLLIFKSPEAINAYAEMLKASGPLVWTVRVILLVSFVLHVHAAYALTMLNRGSRPRGYATQQLQSSTWAARSLRVGGVVLLVFVVYHILHLTTGTVHPAFSPLDVHGNVRIGLGVPWVAAFYILAMLALGLHLRHGIWSLFQTLGLNHPRLDPVRLVLAIVLGFGLALGFVAVPLGVLLGVIR